MIIRDVWVPDFDGGRWFHTDVALSGDRIRTVADGPLPGTDGFPGNGGRLVPGLIDAHCHIESTLLPPAVFGFVAAADGTLHLVADCHEIANVGGRKGVEWFLENAGHAPCSVHLAVPSCVPATPFNTSGGRLSAEDVTVLLRRPETVSLGELMNVPGVLSRDEHFMTMIAEAKRLGKRVNGHAPGLTGEALQSYFRAGIGDDHEVEFSDEIRERLDMGMSVFLRQGSAERTESDAYRLIEAYPDRILFCTDDRTIADVDREGHLTVHLRKALAEGVPLIRAVQCATRNAARYYGLQGAGEIAPGRRGDVVLLSGDDALTVQGVWVSGRPLADWQVQHVNPMVDFPHFPFQIPDPFEIPLIHTGVRHLAMVVRDGSLITERLAVASGEPEIVVAKDLLKLVVVNRYGNFRTAACRVHGFGLRTGAMATSLSHDCHNIVAVGTSDELLDHAVRSVAAMRGGLVVTDGLETRRLPLPIGGILYDGFPDKLAVGLRQLRTFACALGCQLHDPLSTLSFTALEVIPHLKMTDHGLFDVDHFQYVTGD